MKRPRVIRHKGYTPPPKLQEPARAEPSTFWRIMLLDGDEANIPMDVNWWPFHNFGDLQQVSRGLTDRNIEHEIEGQTTLGWQPLDINGDAIRCNLYRLRRVNDGEPFLVEFATEEEMLSVYVRDSQHGIEMHPESRYNLRPSGTWVDHEWSPGLTYDGLAIAPNPQHGYRIILDDEPDSARTFISYAAMAMECRRLNADGTRHVWIPQYRNHAGTWQGASVPADTLTSQYGGYRLRMSNDICVYCESREELWERYLNLRNEFNPSVAAIPEVRNPVDVWVTLFHTQHYPQPEYDGGEVELSAVTQTYEFRIFDTRDGEIIPFPDYASMQAAWDAISRSVIPIEGILRQRRTVLTGELTGETHTDWVAAPEPLRGFQRVARDALSPGDMSVIVSGHHRRFAQNAVIQAQNSDRAMLDFAITSTEHGPVRGQEIGRSLRRATINYVAETQYADREPAPVNINEVHYCVWDNERDRIVTASQGTLERARYLVGRCTPDMYSIRIYDPATQTYDPYVHRSEYRVRNRVNAWSLPFDTEGAARAYIGNHINPDRLVVERFMQPIQIGDVADWVQVPETVQEPAIDYSREAMPNLGRGDTRHPQYEYRLCTGDHYIYSTLQEINRRMSDTFPNVHMYRERRQLISGVNRGNNEGWERM